jgi:hypothetical protein
MHLFLSETFSPVRNAQSLTDGMESNHGFVVLSGSVSGSIELYRTHRMPWQVALLRMRHGSASPFAEAFVGGHGRHGAVETAGGRHVDTPSGPGSSSRSLWWEIA